MEANKNLETQAIREKLIEMIKPYLSPEIELAKITESSNFITDLKINSARFVDIILDMEDKFNIAIDDQTADKMLTVGDALALVQK